MRWQFYPNAIPDSISDRLRWAQFHGDRSNAMVHLTFDDGPTPVVTDYVIDLLEQYEFKATFFCVGDCVQQHPVIYDRVLSHGHSVGNHTHHHVNRLKTSYKKYLNNINLASSFIDSNLFRPPYGKIFPADARKLNQLNYRVVLWDVLAGDFDNNRTAQNCLDGLIKNTELGSIICFHDSEKAFEKLKEILPAYLEYLKSQNWTSTGLS